MLGLAEIAAGQELAAAQFNRGTPYDRVGCCRKALFAGGAEHTELLHFSLLNAIHISPCILQKQDRTRLNVKRSRQHMRSWMLARPYEAQHSYICSIRMVGDVRDIFDLFWCL